VIEIISATDEAEKISDAQKWRVDPKSAGTSFVLGDLSTYTYYMSQLGWILSKYFKKIRG
jgi:hypothetical protein